MALVEFILPTFNRIDPLRMALSSLLAQTDPDWTAHVLIDGHEAISSEGLIESFKDSRIRYTRTENRQNYWGHPLREKGKNESSAQYVVMTGDDNYYTPNTVSEIRKVVESESSPGLIYWDMIHSHYGYTFFETRLGIGYIDIGAYATRTDLAKQTSLGVKFHSDGEYVHSLQDKFPAEKTYKIKQVLYVHN